MKTAILTLGILCALTAFCEKQPYERYQSIVERQMFGPLPPGFDPTKLPSDVQKASSKEEKELSKEQEKLQSAIHFSVINVMSDGTPVVGFTDNTDPKVPRHFYLKVGEKRGGWEVKEADPVEQTMTILKVKDEIEVSLKLGGNSAKDGGTSKAGGGAAASSSRSTGGPSVGAGTMRERFLQKKRDRQAEAQRQQEQQAKREAEQQAQREADNQQREAERAEQRQQLMAIQEELKRVREQKAAENKDSANEENQPE